MINDFFVKKMEFVVLCVMHFLFWNIKKNFVNFFQIEPATKVIPLHYILIYLRTMPIKKHEFIFEYFGLLNWSNKYNFILLFSNGFLLNNQTALVYQPLSTINSVRFQKQQAWNMQLRNNYKSIIVPF